MGKHAYPIHSLFSGTLSLHWLIRHTYLFCVWLKGRSVFQELSAYNASVFWERSVCPRVLVEPTVCCELKLRTHWNDNNRKKCLSSRVCCELYLVCLWSEGRRGQTGTLHRLWQALANLLFSEPSRNKNRFFFWLNFRGCYCVWCSWLRRYPLVRSLLDWIPAGDLPGWSLRVLHVHMWVFSKYVSIVPN